MNLFSRKNGSYVMKKYLLITIITLLAIVNIQSVKSQPIDKNAIIDSLTTMDPEIMQYFPRWKVCEPDLAFQIRQSFILAGYDKSKLSTKEVQVLAAPREFDYLPYDILMIKCGDASMNAMEISSNIGDMLVSFLSGDYYYTGRDRGYPKDVASRDYCYQDIPVSIPVSDDEREAIENYLQPSNVDHAITLSLFEQVLKIGNTGFWVKSILGNDKIGYPFWNAGERSIVLRRPLYRNEDSKTNRAINYLINAYLGGSFKIDGGLTSDNDLLSWVKNRTLNSSPGGKLIGGLDFHLPIHPQAGASFDLEIPLSSLEFDAIDPTKFGYIRVPDGAVEFPKNEAEAYPVNRVAPILRSTGQFTLFYNWWLDDENPENYFRFDLGLSYAEVQEAAIYYDSSTFETKFRPNNMRGTRGLNMYNNDEFGDWLFAKLEYRNQASFPFGASVQYSNQIMMARVYVPLFGKWLYIEGKYATPLRKAYPYEVEHFFMISPVLRLTI